jgi:hypothetical protein
MAAFRRSAPTFLATLALAAAIADGSGAHRHGLQERDLAPHALMLVAGSAACGSQAHFDTAVRHQHFVCGSCTLASNPTHAAAPSPEILGDETIVGLVTASAPRFAAAASRTRGPARAPPSRCA